MIDVVVVGFRRCARLLCLGWCLLFVVLRGRSVGLLFSSLLLLGLCYLVVMCFFLGFYGVL